VSTPRDLRTRRADAGVTLVEALVALVIFALIGAAGLAVLDQVLRVQSATEGRLQHLAAMQRTMHLVTQDFMQAAGGSLRFADGTVAIHRDAAAGQVAVRYGLEDATLVRRVAGGFGGPAARQELLDGVAGVAWRFYRPDLGWIDTWPPEPFGPRRNPAAVELDVTLADGPLAGHLRRIALLPGEVTP
jgi:general secretion pathway protein J